MADTDTIHYEEELRESFLEYSMSVITSRALPDVRDGLKPVQRRVLYAMFREGHTHDSKYTKCAGIVGEVLKRYHPHGDSSVYDTLVRLTQDWVLRYPLVDGQGNFGSIDGDSPAAYRYTEAKLAAVSETLLSDIRKNTVDFAPNYNNTDIEPVVFPARIPQLLINGCAGIAVGMATNIPPHNLEEVIDACVHVLENPESKTKDLFNFIKGPDFPTGGLILGKKDFKDGYLTGKGFVKMRGIVDIEDIGGGRQAIVISALPYNVNKARLIERIADLVKARKLDGIQELRDESDKKGMRIFIGLRKGSLANLIVEKLYQQTPLQSNFTMNFVALVGGKPKTLTLIDLIQEFLGHRKEVVRRRSLYELHEAKKRAHILEGLKIIVDAKDEYLKKILPASKDKATLKETIEERFQLSPEQSEAIVILPNYRFSGLERDKIIEEYKEISAEIKRLEELLGSEKKLISLIKSELLEVKQKYGDKRRSRFTQDEGDVDTEELIPDDPCFVAVTADGFYKRYTVDAETNLEEGRSRVVTVGEDVVAHSYAASLHKFILPLYSDGTVYSLKAHQLPNMRRYAKGAAIHELLGLKEPLEEKLVNVLLTKDVSKKDTFVVVVTKQATIKKIPLEELAGLRRSGAVLLRPRKKDTICSAFLCSGKDKIIIVTNEAKAYAVQASQIPTHTKGVSAGFNFDSMKDVEVVGAFVESGAVVALVDDGLLFGTSAKEVAAATAAKPVSLRSLRSKKLVASAGVDAGSEIIIVTQKSGALTATATGRPSTLEKELDFKKGDSVHGIYVLAPLADQLSLPLS